jgi:hypothetical protein
MPAHPWTVAAYARWCEPRHRHQTIVKHVRAIARMHVLHCLKPPDRHPTVARTMRAIETRTRTRRAGAALFRAEDFAAAEARDAGPPSGPERDTENESRGRRGLRATPRLVPRRPSRL